MIPSTLNEWTLEKIREIADAGVIENDLFDLKADLQPADHQRKTVAAFANSAGGFLVFGVTNARLVEGVANVELARDFGNSLRDGIAPSVDFRFASSAHALPSGRLVYVVHVPRSTRGPHAVYVNNSWSFLKRTPSGSNDPMSYEEVRLAFQDTETRRTKLVLLSSELGHLRFLAQHLLNEVPENAPIDGLVIDAAWATRYPTNVLDLLLGDAFSLVARTMDLWSALEALRAEVRHSNAMAEAYSHYDFVRSTKDSQQRKKLYAMMRQRAGSIAMYSEKAKALVDATLMGTA